MTTRHRRHFAAAAVFLAVVAVCWFLRANHPIADRLPALPGWVEAHVVARFDRMVGGWALTAIAVYPVAVLAILLLERRFPAIPDQPVLSVGLLHDSVWVLLQSAAVVTIMSVYSGALSSAYDARLSFLTLSPLEEIPQAVRGIVAIVAVDGVRWVRHILHHKIPVLWLFHAVHHSQREINLFSDYRTHFVELLVDKTLFILAGKVFGLSLPNIVLLALVLVWHARFQHSNIRTNLGILRYIFVTPQSHRVHHSIDQRHRDLNYGALFSFWDFLFRTQYRRYDEYPSTGVDDDRFPLETSTSLASLAFTPLRQTLYPFQRLWSK